jgi:hypothetical protein
MAHLKNEAVNMCYVPEILVRGIYKWILYWLSHLLKFCYLLPIKSIYLEVHNLIQAVHYFMCTQYIFAVSVT